MRTGEAQFVAEKIHQMLAHKHIAFDRLTIDMQADTHALFDRAWF
jgi:hypothetical protein